MIESNLGDVRKKWEKGLSVKSIINQGHHDRILVVLEREGKYHCHRYFVLGGKWVCSVDSQFVGLSTVWAWLSKMGDD